jgi:dihydropteroate synthase
MQAAPRYYDVVDEVRGFLKARAAACLAAGVARERLVVDPGFGFGKTLEHNLALLAALPAIAADGLPVLAGLSRKRMIGALTGRTGDNRLAGSLAAAVIAAINGARIIRAHDVAATVDALAVVAGAGALRDNRG